MDIAVGWFSIALGIVCSVIAVMMQWLPIPLRWRDSGLGRFRRRTLSVRMTALIGIELLCAASILDGVGKLQNISWWWPHVLALTGSAAAIWAILGGPRRKAERRDVS